MFHDLYFVSSDVEITFSLGKNNCVECVVGRDNFKQFLNRLTEKPQQNLMINQPRTRLSKDIRNNGVPTRNNKKKENGLMHQER